MYVEVRKIMYDLTQAGILAQHLLKQWPAKYGYTQFRYTPEFLKHLWRPISFTLIINDFGVKYIVKEHAQHLINVLENDYEISKDWEGGKYVRLTFNWDYYGKKMHVSMTAYVSKGLKRFEHKMPKNDRTSRTPKTNQPMEPLCNIQRLPTNPWISVVIRRNLFSKF